MAASSNHPSVPRPNTKNPSRKSSSNNQSLSAAVSSIALSLNALSPASHIDGDVLKVGWLLKKRRRKMQGFAMRYFRLHSSGLLSYAVHPETNPRDQINLGSAVISSNPAGPNDVHIDSDYSTFHIRFQSSSDSSEWMSLFRKFIHSSTLPQMSASLLDPNLELSKDTQEILHSLGETIADLRATSDAIKQDEANLKSPSFFRFRRDKDKDYFAHPSSKETDSFFQKIKKGNLDSVSLDASNTRNDSSTNRASFLQRGEQLDAIAQRLTTQYQRLISSLTSQRQHTIGVHRSPILYPNSHSVASLHARRGSTRTLLSLSPSERTVWFDAVDGHIEGGSEVFIDADPGDDPSTHSTDELQTELDTDAELVVEPVSVTNGETLTHSRNSFEPPQVARRVHLPSPMIGDEGSLFAALRKNIGKDLSNVSFPVSFNEPLSLLQRLSEDMEYTEILDRAVACDDHVDRMCYVAAFCVSGFACTKMRTGRKSFTPMLAETFEDIRCNFIAEKVSHVPLVMACHATGDGWEYWCTHAGKTKFWGKSLEIIQTGTSHLRIGKHHYEWHRPSTFVRNLVVGAKYLEHCGQLTIVEPDSKLKCVLDFKETGYWGTSPNVVDGSVFDDSGQVNARLNGTWHEQINRVLDSSHLQVLWKANPWPRDALDYYGLTGYAMSLNEFTSDIEGKLPMTDSRYRPDIRYMEEGEIDRADSEKIRLEALQRSRRNRNDPLIQPRWFEKVAGSEEYVYKGGYWEQRALGWSKNEPIWT